MGRPWAVITHGFFGYDWSTTLQDYWKVRLERDSQADCALMNPNGSPVSYAAMLQSFRGMLSKYNSIDSEHLEQYTLHSCKATGLAWAKQLELNSVWRHCMGHHKSVSVSEVYGRDDTLGAIRGQQAMQRSIANGWRPLLAIRRGGSTPLPEKTFNATLKAIPQGLLRGIDIPMEQACTSIATERPAANSSDDSSSSGSQKSSEEENSDHSGGVLLLSKNTEVLHSASVCSSGLPFRDLFCRLACNNNLQLDEQIWQPLTDDPELRDTHKLCRHKACRAGNFFITVCT